MDATPEAAPSATFSAPSWVQDAVFYQIFPDRFASSPRVPKPSNLETWDSPPTVHGFKGGDLVGVTEHLDYLQDLGITAIYFCPIFQSTANHRYHTYDYFQVDHILGGNEAFRLLLDQAHSRGMRVVIDGVFNHSSRGFFQFNHILENGEASPYIDWFTVYSWPLFPYGPADKPAGYWSWWDNRALPKFNTNTAAVREFLWSVGAYWIEQGVDGWRLDVPNEIDDDEFWREFRRRVKSANPDAYIVGEIWGDARRWLQGDQFDAVMNYVFTRAAIGFFTRLRGIDESALEGTGLHPVPQLDAVAFAEAIHGLLGLYPWSATISQLNLLDSHDTARFLTIARNDTSALKLAMFFQMTFPGAPCVYYGDEIGMVGGETNEDARRGFIWKQEQWNEELRDHLRRCISLRRKHEVLRQGAYTTRWAGEDVYIFERRTETDAALIALNASGESRTIDLDGPDDLCPNSVSASFNTPVPPIQDGRVRQWTLSPRAGSALFFRLPR